MKKWRLMSADRIAGYDGAYARKRALAEWVVGLKIPLTANVVIHRANIERIDEFLNLALDMGASRVEMAHVQYYGWACSWVGIMPDAYASRNVGAGHRLR